MGTALTYAVIAACDWSAFENNCEDGAQCGGDCFTSSKILFSASYCQVQGNYCCECRITTYRCLGTGNCNPSYFYDRERVQTAGYCENSGGSTSHPLVICIN